MIISHEHKFIYIAIPKTGSRTVTRRLIKYAENKISNNKKSPYYRHGSAKELKKQFEKEGWDWDSYYKFTFVRNPWDRVLSMYSYIRMLSDQYVSRTGKYAPGACLTQQAENVMRQGERFERFIRRYNTFEKSIDAGVIFSYISSQLDYINDEKGERIIDFVGRIENFQEDYDYVCGKIGIPKKRLMHLNKTQHKKKEDCYSEKAKEIVANKFEDEIEELGNFELISKNI